MASEEAVGPVAAVDCGTNSTRLLVVGADGAVLERSMHITRLGEGVDATRRLSPEALSRTLSVLRRYRAAMDAHGVLAARLVATSAVRDAENAEEFMAGAAQATGMRPEILSGLKEANLSFAGATRHLPAGVTDTAPLLVVDIGGGSTELAVGVPGGDVAAVSLDIGCVRVSERHLHHDPPTAAELADARAAVDEEVGRAGAVLPAPGPGGPVVGLAGTVSTLACLIRAVPVYDRAVIHHSELGRGDVERWLGILSGEDSRSRLTRPGMVEGREDVIVGGALILASVMEIFERHSCVVSEDDILDGLAMGLLAAGG